MKKLTFNAIKVLAATFTIASVTTGIVMNSNVQSETTIHPYTVSQVTDADDVKVMLSTDNETFVTTKTLSMATDTDKTLVPLKMYDNEFYYSSKLDKENTTKVAIDSDIVESYTIHQTYYIKADKAYDNMGLYIITSFLGGASDIDMATSFLFKYNTDQYYGFSYSGSQALLPDFSLTSESQKLEVWIYRDLMNDYCTIDNINAVTSDETLRFTFYAYGLEE